MCFGYRERLDLVRTCLLVEGLANILEAAAATPALAGGDGLLLLLLLVGGAEEGGHLVDARTSALMIAVAHAASHCYPMVRSRASLSTRERAFLFSFFCTDLFSHFVHTTGRARLMSHLAAYEVSTSAKRPTGRGGGSIDSKKNTRA